MEVLVLSVDEYEFLNQETGEIVSGATIFYLVDTAMKPVKLSLNSYSDNMYLLSNFTDFSAIYDFKLKTEVVKNQLVQKVEDVKFVRKVDIFEELKIKN